MKSVLFLDIDDVLCLSDSYGGFSAVAAVRNQHFNPDAVDRELLAPAAVLARKRIHEEMRQGVRYVISSTWRESFTRHELVTVFHRAGLGFVADNLAPGGQWRTSPKLRRSQRIHEIGQWLDEHHDGAPFVIVDDSHSGTSLLPVTLTTYSEMHPYAGRVALCLEGVGLTDSHVAPLLDALRREAMPSVATTGTTMAGKTQQ